MASSKTVLSIMWRRAHIFFSIPGFSFLEGNSDTNGRNEDEDDFSFSLQSFGVSRLLQNPEGTWDVTNSKISIKAKQCCISTDKSTIQQWRDGVSIGVSAMVRSI